MVHTCFIRWCIISPLNWLKITWSAKWKGRNSYREVTSLRKNKKNDTTWALLYLLVTKSHNFLYNAKIQHLWIYEAVLLVCLFVFFMDTEIISPDTENIAATYPSSLKGHGYFDVVYLSFQNTSTQTWKNLMSFHKWQPSFLCLWKLLLYRLKENERIVFQSLFVFHPGEEEVFDTRL